MKREMMNKHIINHKHIINNMLIMILVLIFLLLFSGIIYYKSVLPVCKNEKHNIYFNMENDEKDRIYIKDKEIKQEFCLKDNISSIIIFFNNDEEINSESNVSVEIRKVDNNQTIQKWELSGKEISSSNLQQFDLDNSLNKYNGKYVLLINQKDREGKISLQASNKDIYYDGNLFIGTEQQDSDICFMAISENSMFLSKLFWIFDIFLIIGIEVIYYSIFIKRCKIENLFIICALFVGFVYMFLITPYSVSDESGHINTAYRYSNIWTNSGGYQADNGDMYKRKSDISVFGLSTKPSISTYYTVYSNFFCKSKDNSLIQVQGERIGNITQYIPSSIGITIARVLDLGYIPMIYLARLCNFIFYLVLIRCAIKKIPFAKILLFVIALTPLAIQQAASVSYDAIVISLIFFVIASWIKLAYGEDNEIRNLEFISLIITSGLLAGCKGGIYIFLWFLATLISWKKIKQNKKIRIVIIGSILIAIGSILFFNYAKIYYTVTVENKSLSDYNQQIAYSYSYIFNNPCGFLSLIYNTIKKELDYYVISTLGGILGWNNVKLPIVIVLANGIILLLSALKDKDEKDYLDLKDKMKILFVCFCVICTFFTATLTWNPISNNYIDGIRGRYIIPIMPLIMLLFRNNTIVKQKNIDKQIIFTLCLIQFITINVTFINIISN